MSRVVVVGLKEHEDRILSFLHDRGVIQVEPVSKETLAQFSPERPTEEQRKLAEEHLRFKALVAALPSTPVGERRQFADIPALLRAASEISCDEEVRKAKREEDALITELKLIADQRRAVEDYAFFPEDLSVLTARSILSYLGTAPEEKYLGFRSEVSQLSSEALFVEEQGERSVRFVVSVPRTKADAFGRLAQKHNVALMAVPELAGRPREILPRLQARQKELEGRLEGVRASLRQISDRWYRVLVPIEEQLTVEARKADVHGRLAGARTTFALEGFVPSPEVPKLRAELERLTNGRSELYDTPAGEEAPTLMRNPQGPKVYEFFIRFFSLPQSNEIDPTMVFAVVFPIFFGFMLGDVGYGAFILAVCLWMIWRIGNPNAGPTLVPKFLVRFTTMVMPAPAMKQLAKALLPGCLIGIALGVCFDSYFGFTLGQITAGAFDFALFPGHNGVPGQVTYIAKLLLVAVYIGLAVVTLGLVFGAINAYYHHNRKHLLSRIFWILVAWGIILFGFSFIGHYPGSWLIAFPQYQLVYLGILIVGALGAIATEGLLAGIEVATMMSRVLSFARLVGILLASVILAFVINGIAVVGISGQSGLVLHGVGFAVFGVVLVVIGAVFNIILGVFEPGIQGARLLYVEYFANFYHGNGKAFKPFGGGRTYTLPQHASLVEGPASPATAPPPTPRAAR